jgi:hypothetical protein
MKTVHEVAEHYGVSDAFMVRALERLGLTDATPETGLATAILTRFEAAFGAKIRANRPEPQPAFRAETDAAPTASRAVRQPKPHVMRVAHSAVTGKRDASGYKVKALLDDPRVVHALDAAGTWDGDPWSGEVVRGSVHFFGGTRDSGPYAACGTVRVRAVLGDEFVPADPGDREAVARQCPRCAELVAEGKGFRTPPQERPLRSYFCEQILRLRIDDDVDVQECSLRDLHGGPHRTRDGATWRAGFDDFVPAPLDTGRRITKAP